MKPGEERLELVTDFASLRAGMIVVVKPCSCGKAVRGMLVEFRRDGEISSKGGRVPADAWLTEPGHGCGPWRFPHVVSTRTVADRRVYRVVDGLDPEADKETARNDAIAAHVHARVNALVRSGPL